MQHSLVCVGEGGALKSDLLMIRLSHCDYAVQALSPGNTSGVVWPGVEHHPVPSQCLRVLLRSVSRK
jgi:hypothetical protein